MPLSNRSQFSPYHTIWLDIFERNVSKLVFLYLRFGQNEVELHGLISYYNLCYF